MYLDRFSKWTQLCNQLKKWKEVGFYFILNNIYTTDYSLASSNGKSTLY